jgi:hypothetical protein
MKRQATTGDFDLKTLKINFLFSTGRTKCIGYPVKLALVHPEVRQAVTPNTGQPADVSTFPGWNNV